MAPKSKSDDFGKILKSGQKVLKKVSKAAQLAKGAKGILGRAKEAAGESKCKTKSCTLKERLQDFAERAIRGGKSLFGEKEKIKSMAEEGKRLISGESSKKSKMMKPKKQESKPKKQDPSPSTPPQAPPAPRAPPAKVSSQSKPDRSQLNAQIKKGYQLKKVQQSEKKEMKEKKNSGRLEDNLQKAIENALKNRRRSSREDDD